MARAHRLDPVDGIHHVVNRGIDHGDVFIDDDSRLEFGRCLAVIAERYGVRVLAYCLMTNHFHLVVRCPSGGLPDAMQYLAGVFTRRTNDRLGRDGPIFRGRYTSRLITTSRYVLNAISYTHRNALDLPGVTSVEAYRWSSHRAYLGLRPTPEWLDTGHVLQWFDDEPSFHRFVLAQAAAQDSIEPQPLLDAIAFVLASTTDGGRVRPGDVRAVALHIAERLGGAAEAAIVETLAFTSDGARRHAVTRARRRLCDEPELASLASAALDLTARQRAA